MLKYVKGKRSQKCYDAFDRCAESADLGALGYDSQSVIYLCSARPQRINATAIFDAVKEHPLALLITNRTCQKGPKALGRVIE